jgi:hypothetical protein
MTDGTIKRHVCFVAGAILLQSPGISARESPLPMGKKYWTDHTNVVAAVSAYERTVALPTGEQIPAYSLAVDEKCTNYTAVIFYILSPVECAGAYFRLEAVPPEPGSGYLPPAYYTNTTYYFPYMGTNSLAGSLSNAMYWCGITASDLSRPITSAGRMNVGKTSGKRYYPSVRDAVEALEDLADERYAVAERMTDLSNRIEHARAEGIDVKKDPQHRRLRGEFFGLHNRLSGYDYRRQEIKMQIEKLQQLEAEKTP